MPKTATRYRVWNDGTIVSGDARDVLETVRARGARKNDELKTLDVDGYAKALIDDAAYFLPVDLLNTLKEERFQDDYERALSYLANMPTSRVRILSRI